MHIVKTGALSAVAALGFTGIAHAEFASPLTSERDAAAGLVTAFQLRTDVPWEIAVLTYRTRDYADRALRILAANTTPAALLAAPNGRSFPCAISGSVNARLSRTLPRTLKLEWIACVFENGIRHSLTGPGEVVLPADTFSPSNVKSVRVGSPTRDLNDQLDLLNSEPGVPSTVNTLNIRMTGLVPLARATDTDPFEGSFAYELAGRAYERVYFQRAGEGDALFAQEMSVTAKNGYVTGFLDYGRRDDMNCGCGIAYSYDTKIPARRVAGYNDMDFYDAGKIVINGNTTARFSLVGNPDDGQLLMHTDLDVNYVGSFDYETEPENLGSLQFAARCP